MHGAGWRPSLRHSGVAVALACMQSPRQAIKGSLIEQSVVAPAQSVRMPACTHGPCPRQPRPPCQASTGAGLAWSRTLDGKEHARLGEEIGYELDQVRGRPGGEGVQ